MKIFKLLLTMSLLSIMMLVPNKANANTESADYLVYEKADLNAFTELDLNLINTAIEIQSGDKYSIKIFLSEDNLSYEDIFNIENNKGHLIINEKDWMNNIQSILFNLKSRFVITVPEMENLISNVEFINGEIKIANSINELSLEYVNGDTKLSGNEVYPMEIEFINGDIILEFENYDADFNIKFVNGYMEILGDEFSSRFSDFNRIIQEGKNDIHIDAVNGSVKIIEQKR